MAPAVATYAPHDPSHTVLYHVVADHLETFLASLDADPDAKGLPAYVQREFYDYLQCSMIYMSSTSPAAGLVRSTIGQQTKDTMSGV